MAWMQPDRVNARNILQMCRKRLRQRLCNDHQIDGIQGFEIRDKKLIQGGELALHEEKIGTHERSAFQFRFIDRQAITLFEKRLRLIDEWALTQIVGRGFEGEANLQDMSPGRRR